MSTPSGHADAQQFTRELPDAPQLRQRLETLATHLRALAIGPAHPLDGAREVREVFRFAASGLDFFLHDPPGQVWATLGRLRLWAVNHTQRASDLLPVTHVAALHEAMSVPEVRLPDWAQQAQRAGHVRLAGQLAAWWAVTNLVQEVPLLHDGELEDILDATLLAFCGLELGQDAARALN